MRSWLDRTPRPAASPARRLAAACAALFLLALGAACSSPAESAASIPSAADAGGAAPVPSIPGRSCPERSPLTYQSFGAPFFLTYCTGCHASTLTGDRRQKAPADVNLDTLADIRAHLQRIYARAADDHTTMPPAGGPAADVRKELGDWLACGAPGEEVRFTATSLPPRGPIPAACDGRPTPLPPALLPRCSAETWSCIAACDVLDFACPGRCLAADKTPPEPTYGFGCTSCIDYQKYTCSDENGCHSVNAALECCRQAKCASGADPGCLVKSCPSEAYAYGYCLGAVTPTCDSIVDGPARGCFPPAVTRADAGAD